MSEIKYRLDITTSATGHVMARCISLYGIRVHKCTCLPIFLGSIIIVMRFKNDRFRSIVDVRIMTFYYEIGENIYRY